MYNVLAARPIFPGILAGYLLATGFDVVIGFALAVTAGGFLCVALADLVPQLHGRQEDWRSVARLQVAPLLAGIALIWVVHALRGG